MPIFFPDVSHYQSGLSLMGAVACLAKATQGTGYTDPSYATFKADAARRGIPFGAYHWLDTTDAAAQARHCHSVVGSTPLMIDDEQNRIDVGHTLAFVAAYRALGGRVVLEYAPQWVWSASGKPDLSPLAKAGLFIVSSSYPGIGYTSNGPGWNSYGGITPAIWQYTSTQMFNGRACDFNAYRGSLADLRNLLFGSAPTPTEDDVMKFVRTETGAVWLTNGITRYHIPDPGAYAIALKTQGQTTADVIQIKEAELPAWGADVTAAGAAISADQILNALAVRLTD